MNKTIKIKPNSQVEQLRAKDKNLITKNNNEGVCSNAKLGMYLDGSKVGSCLFEVVGSRGSRISLLNNDEIGLNRWYILHHELGCIEKAFKLMNNGKQKTKLIKLHNHCMDVLESLIDCSGLIRLDETHGFGINKIAS